MNASPTFRLRLFGSPSLESDGSVLSGRATQRHRLALLALLAQAPARRLTRDKLLALLWPERDADRGRNLLKVATYVLRETLGERALLSEGDDLRLNTEIVRVDVAEFEAALERADPARAVGIYVGPFLDGFFLSETPEFERWVERERERLAASYGKALESLADAAERDQDTSRAVEWWKARAVHDPYDSRVALRLIKALDASGNRVGALQHASVHQRLLHEEFGTAAVPEITALVERMRGEPEAAAHSAHRYAVTPGLSEPPLERASKAATISGDAAGGDRKRARWSEPWRAAAAFLTVFALAGAVWASMPRKSAADPSIAVLPFVNFSADEENEYFSDGLTEEIITRLAAVPELKVISRTSVMHYKGSKQPLRAIAGELTVAHILEGSVRHADGRVRISAQLIDTRTDEHLWAENYEYELQDSFRVQEDIAQAVVTALEQELGKRLGTLPAKQGTRDAEAYRLYRRGRFVWNTRTRRGHEQALEYFQQAIQRDSAYADAYAGIADVYLTAYQLNLTDLSPSESYSRLKWAAERALALDERSADAHTAFAVALWWQRNWPGAERELRRALELNPSHATARSWYSLLLRGMGRAKEAVRESDRASVLDPFAVVVSHNYGWQCYLDRDYACAIEQYRASVDIGRLPAGYRGLGLVYARQGKLDEAMREVRKGIEVGPERHDFLADIAYVYALGGARDSALVYLQRAKAQPVEGFNIARAYVALGQPDSAFAWLDRSSWVWPHRAARGDPALEPLWSDPRFARLSARIDREMGIR